MMVMDRDTVLIRLWAAMQPAFENAPCTQVRFPQAGYTLDISCTSAWDPTGNHRPRQRIRVVFTQEMIQQYQDEMPEQRAQDDEKLRDFAEERLQEMSACHGRRSVSGTASETWTVTPERLMRNQTHGPKSVLHRALDSA